MEDKIAEESIRFFEDVATEQETPKSLSEKTGYSLKTVYNRINQGKEIISEQIREMGKSYLAQIWYDYEKVKKAAWRAWENSIQRGGDVNYLKEYRAVLEAQRKMLSVDAPAKAPVNEEGKAATNQLILVFPDDNYKLKEIEYEEKQLNQIAPPDSTTVPLLENRLS